MTRAMNKNKKQTSKFPLRSTRLLWLERNGMIRTARLMLVILLVAATAHGQDEAPKTSKGVTPVEIKLTPEKTLPGGQVTISGTVPFVPDKKTVSITVTFKPEPRLPGSPPLNKEQEAFLKPHALTTQVMTAAGGFSIVFSDTAVPGEYEVVAVSPDQKGRTQKSFEVVELDDAEDLV